MYVSIQIIYTVFYKIYLNLENLQKDAIKIICNFCQSKLRGRR